MRSLSAWFKLLRPGHWIKNLVCLAGVLFYQRWSNVPEAFLLALCFSLTASTVYIINDLFDVERDRNHPKKKNRPLAAGVISAPSAIAVALLLAFASVTFAFLLHFRAGICCVLYLLINLTYSLKLKHLPVVDAFCIAFGFVLRLLAGIYLLEELPVAWLVLFTFFLSLFLGFAKRRAELVAMEDAPTFAERRPVLNHYSLTFLDGALDISSSLAMGCYALFILLPSSLKQNPSLVVTVPLVVFMILHYKRRLTHPKYRIEPNRIIFNDFTMQGVVLLWLVLYVVIQQSAVVWFQ